MYIYIYIYNQPRLTSINQYFLQAITNAIQLQIIVKIYAKFHVLFKNILWKITTKFISTLVLSLAHKKISYIGWSLANGNTKDPIVGEIHSIARSDLI